MDLYNFEWHEKLIRMYGFKSFLEKTIQPLSGRFLAYVKTYRKQLRVYFSVFKKAGVDNICNESMSIVRLSLDYRKCK